MRLLIMSKIGYIRVSTEHQETARQKAIMKQYEVERVFAEKMSRKNANRPELKAMLDYVREGDTLYIESISRLGRSTRDLLNIIDMLQRKGVTIVSSKENIDTNTPQGRFVMSIFAALSELERDQTLQLSVRAFSYSSPVDMTVQVIMIIPHKLLLYFMQYTVYYQIHIVKQL